MYSIPSKPKFSDKIQSKKQVDCYAMLNQLISKVKTDVSMNQSRAGGKTSRLMKQTDMTNESGFPNVTHEEFHFTLNQQNNDTTAQAS